MKALLTLTLLLNVALAGWIGFELKRPRGIAVDEQTNGVSSAELPTSLRAKRAQTQTVVVTNKTQFAWRKVASPDFKTYLANLRAIGCPEETVRDIIIAEVQRYYAPRFAEFRKPPEEYQFWKTGNNYGAQQPSPDDLKKMREVSKESEAMLKELLGDDYRKDMARQSPYGYGMTEDAFMEGLAKEKRSALETIQSEFNDKRSDIYRKAKGTITQEDQEEIRRIERQMHDEMAKVLSPQELFDYEVRTSQLASNMKYNELRGFDPTEQEFRALFKAKQEVDWMNAAAEKRDKDWQTRYQALNAELKTALGEDRYRQYERSKDYEYQNLLRLTEARDLPREAADKVYQLKEEAQKAASEIKRNKELTEEQRTQALQTLHLDVEKVGVETLGERNFKAYTRSSSWLRSLAAPTSTRQPAATRITP